ncbi:MAG: MmcQ/YjbR family DNA-binding protein [Candidatus Nanopelagicales bacterium]
MTGSAATWRIHMTLRELEGLALALPEARRVDVEGWDGQPTFRVRGKNFAFTDRLGSRVTVKLTAAEAEWVVAHTQGAFPARYGLGRHGWVVIPTAGLDPTQLREWLADSYRLVAPKSLARLV